MVTEVRPQPPETPHQGTVAGPDDVGPPSPRRGTLRRLVSFVLTVAVLGGLVLGATTLAVPEKAEGPKLTHTVSRADLLVTVTEQGTVESAENTEIRCKVRGSNTITWVVETGTEVKKDDQLLTLDTLFIEEQIHERSKYAHWCKATEVEFKARMERCELAIQAFLQGQYVSTLKLKEKNLAIAKSDLLTAQNMLRHDKLMNARGYVSNQQVESREFNVTSARLTLQGCETDLTNHKTYDRKRTLETLKGALASAKAEYEAAAERTFADEHRRDVAIEEFKHCVVRAPKDGMVIYPNTAQWKNAPEIEEGGTVYKTQVLLLMPDLSRMQVKIGIHESIVERITTDLEATVSLPGRTLQGQVTDVADVTRPAGWWTGNVVKYDTIISLPDVGDLKPGSSAEVEILVAHHKNVLTLPVAAIVETAEGHLCWITSTDGSLTRRSITVGDSNDEFVWVQSGLQEGEKVVLNPLAFIPEAQQEALKVTGKIKAAKKASQKKPAQATSSTSDGSAS